MASVLVHAPLGVAEFGFDDRDFIQVNESIRSSTGAWKSLGQSFPPDQPERGLYRPLTNLSHAVDYALFGERARGYHLTNVLLYLAVVLLVHALALRYRPSPNFAFAVALVFSVHPVHTGAVDALAGRSELLALGFGLVSILLFLRAVESRTLRALVGSLVAYGLACLSKETGAVLPGVLVFHALLFHPPHHASERARRDFALRSIGAFAVVFVAYLALRSAVLGGFSPSVGVLAGQSLEVRLQTMGAVFWEYLRLLVLPRVLQVDFYYHDVVGAVTILSPGQWAAASILGSIALLLFIVAFLALVIRRLRMSAKGDDDPHGYASDALAIVGLAMFLIFLLPVSHVFDIGALLAERFLLAPSLGFVLLAVLLAGELLRRGLPDRRRRTLIAAGLLVLAAFAGSWRSAARAGEWRDPIRLWQVTVHAIPWDPRVHLNLGAAYLERGHPEEAQEALGRALELEPSNVFALGNIGVVQLQTGDVAGALSTYRRLVGLAPGNAIAWHNLGLAETQRLRHSEAIRHFARSLELNPNFAPAHQNLALSEEAVVRATEFLAAQREAGASSEDPEVLGELAAACTAVGDYACAEHFTERGLHFQGGAP